MEKTIIICLFLIFVLTFAIYVIGSYFENKKTVKFYACLYVILIGFLIICLTSMIIAFIVIL